MSEIYTMPGHLIRRLQQISISVFSDRMRALGHDLTAPQFATLAVLARAPGIDQATLAGMIAHDRPTIGGVVERLEAKGLVTRHQNEKDRRAKVLALTDEGAALFQRLLPYVRDIQPDILPGLTEAERAEFIRLAAKVAEAGNASARAPLVSKPAHDAT
ncbi:transcriptional regulator [Jannaschia sp. EhC01]|nr:transcriptional regulator [Jannaschia sp. EhC01]